MVRRVDALIFRTANLHAVVAFYRAIGIPLSEETDPRSPALFACNLGGTMLAISEVAPEQAPDQHLTSSATIGFRVDSVEKAFLAAKAAGAWIVREPQDLPWGRRAIVLDPDGRPVEFSERRAESA